MKVNCNTQSLLDDVPAKYRSNITPALQSACSNFAKLCARTNLEKYRQRGQGNLDAIVQQICTGKIAELGVWDILKRAGIVCNAPDFGIYEKSQKSFDSDLVSRDYNFHIKSQDFNMAERYGASWLFTKGDSLCTNPDERDILCLTIIKGGTVYLMHRTKAKSMVGNYGKPKKESLQKSKLCIYFDTL